MKVEEREHNYSHEEFYKVVRVWRTLLMVRTRK